jgi:small neutral amino acid transporter SnatA (MarC family)
MDYSTVNAAILIDTFLLLLIGVGPKIALVPYLDLTSSLSDKAKMQVVRKMLSTASITALLLIVFGKLLTRLLHFSTGAMGIAGGIILLIISITMVLKPASSTQDNAISQGTDPLRLAVFPLAVPYLLNPAGIVTLVTVSSEAATNLLIIVIGLLAVIILLDAMVFRWANRVSAHLDENRMLVTEKVFGILLAALAVQLVLDGLHTLGIIHIAGH